MIEILHRTELLIKLILEEKKTTTIISSLRTIKNYYANTNKMKLQIKLTYLLIWRDT